MGIIIRNDDVSANTDYSKLKIMYGIIRELLPEAEIWSGYNLICGGKGAVESVYPDIPLKMHRKEYFYNLSTRASMPSPLCWSEPNHKICSHGLLHVDHTELERQAQEMSIVTSCRILDTCCFIPPFNRYNDSMVEICRHNDIFMVTDLDCWKSFEFQPFNANYNRWYFHSWRMTPEDLRRKICDGLSAQVGADYTTIQR